MSICICGKGEHEETEDGHEFATWEDHWKWLVADDRAKSELYDEITFGHISKPNTAIRHVIEAVDERIDKAIADAIADLLDGTCDDDCLCGVHESALNYPGVKEAMERRASYRKALS